MVNLQNMHDILDKSLKSIWHPCSQMKDYETFKPLLISHALGPYLYLQDGQKIIDAISSWWCKSLGHNHVRLRQALISQAERFEHVIFANTTHEPIIELSDKLTHLTKSLSKVFYAGGDGSCAVEAALKLSLHSRKVMGQNQRENFLALKNAYHGETSGSLSVSDLGLYKNPYQKMLFPVNFISPIYVAGLHDPLWSDIREYWPVIEEQLNALAPTLTAIIVEPIVQGAAGMQIYSADFLRRLRYWSTAHDVHLIADEIMTGLGRTGTMLACEHAQIEPDFICLGKGLTAGWIPFNAILLNENIYDCFYNDYETGHNFLHSHTFSGNALGVSLANETLKILEEEKICEKVQKMQTILKNNLETLAHKTGRLKNIRGIGAIIAADIVTDNPHQRLGFQIFQKAVKFGALLRPLGNTIYWLPPLNTSTEVLTELMEITEKSLLSIL